MSTEAEAVVRAVVADCFLDHRHVEVAADKCSTHTMVRPRSDGGLSTGNVRGFRRWMWKPYHIVGFHKSRSVSGWFCRAGFCCNQCILMKVSPSWFRLAKFSLYEPTAE
jgi:hypothetical protein